MSLTLSLQKRLKDFTLDLAFTAPQGVTVLFGPSGAGKSSIANAVAGLNRPDTGEIRLGERLIYSSSERIFLPPHRRRIGYLFQDARLFPHLSVKQNLLYGRWFAPRGREGADFDQVTDLLGLAPLLSRRPAYLSGGEKSRVALGRALLAKPDMLLLDEPLAALDDARKAEILPYLESLRDHTALPILYISHAMGEVIRLATTLVVIEKGRLVAEGPLAEVLSRPRLTPLFGDREAGSLLSATLAEREADGMVRLESAGGPLYLATCPAPLGTRLQLRILAQDVFLARQRPEGLSALNILEGRVTEITRQGTSVLVRLQIGAEFLLARITERSRASHALAEGERLFLIVKSVAIAPQGIRR